MEAVSKTGVDRIFLIEEEYSLTLREAELAWVRHIIEAVKDGTLTEVQGDQLVWKVTRPDLALEYQNQTENEEV